MRKLYRRLLLGLQDHNEVILVSQYGDSGITKTLYMGDSMTEWFGKQSDLSCELSSRCDENNGDDKKCFVKKNFVVEAFLPKPRMVILGGGHIAVPLSLMASLLKFDVAVFDDRPSFADKRRFPGASEVICDSFEKATQRLTIRESDYVVILTRGHKHDQQCLRSILKGRPPYYLGMIGSRRRATLIRRQMSDEIMERMIKEGRASELLGRLERLHSPIGLSIGAVTPEEIAVSIMAEVVEERRKDRGATAAMFEQYKKCYVDVAPIEWLAQEENDREAENAAIVTVVSTRGSTPREAGAKMAVLADGRTVGSIGGGCAEADVARDARDVIHSGGYRFKTVDLSDSAEEDGMACGGTMEILIEAMRNDFQLQ
jgi:xanthine dehydrogenase accessory factor